MKDAVLYALDVVKKQRDGFQKEATSLAAQVKELKEARNAALGALNDAVDEIRRLQARVEELEGT